MDKLTSSIFAMGALHAPAQLTEAGLEALADGKARVEKEDSFLVKPTDWSFLENYTGVLFEQYEMRSEYDDDDKGNHRGLIRFRREGDSARFVMKEFDHDGKNPLEVECEVSDDFIKMAKVLFPFGTLKKRFYIPIEGSELAWEVDVYLNADGTVKSDWVKLDMEYPEGNEETLPEFPFSVEEGTTINLHSQSEEDEDTVDDLFKNVFITVNHASMLPIDEPDDDDDDDEL